MIQGSVQADFEGIFGELARIRKIIGKGGNRLGEKGFWITWVWWKRVSISVILMLRRYGKFSLDKLRVKLETGFVDLFSS